MTRLIVFLAAFFTLLSVQAVRAQTFVPQLSITLSKDSSSYQVKATVIAPNSCYIGGGARLGLPEGTVAIPEAETVVLSIILLQRPGLMCLQVLSPIYFVVDIPVSDGHSSLIAFTELNGAVVGVRSVSLPKMPALQGGASAELQLDAGEPYGAVIQAISAWVNAMPPEPSRIVANVSMWAPCIGYTYNISEVGPFGFTGRTLLFDLNATVPRDSCPSAVEIEEVFFERNVDREEFDTIGVRFEGDIFIKEPETVE